MRILNAFDSITDECRSIYTWKDYITTVTVGWGLGGILFIWWIVGIVASTELSSLSNNLG